MASIDSPSQFIRKRRPPSRLQREILPDNPMSITDDPRQGGDGHRASGHRTECVPRCGNVDRVGNGSACWARTSDPLINSQLLYQTELRRKGGLVYLLAGARQARTLRRVYGKSLVGELDEPRRGDPRGRPRQAANVCVAARHRATARVERATTRVAPTGGCATTDDRRGRACPVPRPPPSCPTPPHRESGRPQGSPLRNRRPFCRTPAVISGHHVC